MVIRVLEKEEIHGALCLAAGIFNGLEQEEEILRQAEEENLILAGCFGDGPAAGLLGWGMADSGGQILFVFVREEHRRHGMGTAIVDMLRQVCSQKFAVLRITAQAPQEMVPFLTKCGLRVYAPQRQENGRTFFPMEDMLSPVELKPHKNGFRMGLIIGGVCVAVLVLCLLIFLLGKKVVGEVESLQEVQRQEERQKEIPDEPETEVLPGYEEEDPAEESPAEDEGIDDIPAYVASDVSYQMTEENYKEKEAREEATIDYDIDYPQVSGLPSGKDQEVNQILKDAAMGNANTYYLNPTQEIQDFLAEQEELYLGSQVKYRVTYMDDRLLCVIYEDHYFTGSVYGEYLALRTRVIDLETAEIYDVQDVLRADETFVDLWRAKIKEKDPDNYPAAELSDEAFLGTMTGEIIDGRYFANLVLAGDGLRVGFTYAFRSEDDMRLSRGWVTAEFTEEELEPYRQDSRMWELFQPGEN